MVQNELTHYGVKGMKWGKHKTRINTSELKRTYKKDAKDAKAAYKTYKDSMPKIFLGIRDPYFADKKAEVAYEKANAKAKDSRYEYELARSKNKGKATKGLISIAGEREYDRIYDKLLDVNVDCDAIHEKAKKGQLKVEEMLRNQKF